MFGEGHFKVILFSKPKDMSTNWNFFFPFLALWCEVLFHTENAFPLGKLSFHIKNLKKGQTPRRQPNLTSFPVSPSSISSHFPQILFKNQPYSHPLLSSYFTQSCLHSCSSHLKRLEGFSEFSSTFAIWIRLLLAGGDLSDSLVIGE